MKSNFFRRFTFVVVLACLANVASAQLVKSRKPGAPAPAATPATPPVSQPHATAPAAPAAPAQQPAVTPPVQQPAQAPAAPTPTPTTPGDTLEITTVFPESVVRGEKLKVELKAKGGKAPYKWVVRGCESCVVEEEGKFYAYNVYHHTGFDDNADTWGVTVTDADGKTKTAEFTVTLDPGTLMSQDYRNLSGALSQKAPAQDLKNVANMLLTDDPDARAELREKHQGSLVVVTSNRLDATQAKVRGLQNLIYILFGVLVLVFVCFRIPRLRRLVFGLTVLLAVVLVAGQPVLQAAPAGRVISIAPDATVQDSEVAVTIRCTGCANTASIEFPSGVSASDVKFEKGVVTAKVKVDASADPGPVQFNLIQKDGSKLESGERVQLYVFTTATATGIDYLKARQTTGDPASRHFLQQFFQTVYGNADGQKRFTAYVRKPTHGAIQELLGKMMSGLVTKQQLDASVQATGQELAGVKLQITEVGGKADTNQQAITELQTVRGETQQRLSNVEGWLPKFADAVTKQQTAVDALYATDVRQGSTKVKRSRGFMGFGGFKPLDPDVEARIGAILDQSRAATQELAPLTVTKTSSN